DQYRVAIDAEGRATVDGRPLIFYHFHSFTLINRVVVLPVKHTHYVLTREILEHAFVPYAAAVLKATSDLQVLFPELSLSFSGDVRMTADHTFLARRAHARALGEKNLPHVRIELEGQWDAYCSSQVTNVATRSPQPGSGREWHLPRRPATVAARASAARE